MGSALRWLVAAAVLPLAAAPAAGADRHYEVVTSNVTYSVSPNMSVYAEPFFTLKLASGPGLQAGLPILPAFNDAVNHAVSETGWRYQLWVAGGQEVRIPEPPVNDHDINLGLAIAAGTVATMMLAPEAVPVVSGVGSVLGLEEPLADIVNEQVARLFTIGPDGKVQLSAAHIDSSSDLGVTLHLVEDHVTQLNSEPVLSREIGGKLFAWVAGDLFFAEMPGSKVVAKTLEEALTEKSVDELAELTGGMIGSGVANEVGLGPESCPPPIEVPGFIMSIPVICPNALTPSLPLSAPSIAIAPMPAAAAIAALPAAVAAQPAVQALRPALADIQTITPVSGTVVLRVTPMAHPPPNWHPPPPQTYSSPPPASGEPTDEPPPENWSGLPTGVTIVGPINGGIDFTRDP